MKKPVDLMEVGINGNNLATSAMRQHPIEELQQRQGTYDINIGVKIRYKLMLFALRHSVYGMTIVFLNVFSYFIISSNFWFYFCFHFILSCWC